MQTTTTVVADVDDDTIALVVLAHHLAVDGAERIIAHARDVYIAEATIRETLYLSFASLDPALVE